MHLVYTPPTRVSLMHLEQIHRRLPSLQELFANWQCSAEGTLSEELMQRERLLGPATLSSASLCLLYDLVSPYIEDISRCIYWHRPTQSAVETQAVLPPQVLVQKTVSVEMAGQLLLWTSVGAREHTLEQRRAVAKILGLPQRAAKQCSTNPATCSPNVLDRSRADALASELGRYGQSGRCVTLPF